MGLEVVDDNPDAVNAGCVVIHVSCNVPGSIVVTGFLTEEMRAEAV
jgi:hypothetical protein